MEWVVAKSRGLWERERVNGWMEWGVGETGNE